MLASETMTESKTVAEALADAQKRVAAAGADTPALDVEVLLAHVLGWSRARLIAERRAPLSAPEERRFAGLVERRCRREPVAYLTGEREFWSLPLEVDARVLVPRPETERLVEVALEIVARLAAEREPGAVLRVVDVGTGSGAIALALAYGLAERTRRVSDPAVERAAVEIVALDRSAAALEVARRNAVRLGSGRARALRFLRGDLLQALADASVDLIVANPPYLSDTDLAAAPAELGFEPREALVGGDLDGLGVIRRLIHEGRRALRRGGFLVSELGEGQGWAVRSVAVAAGFAEAEIAADLGGRERVLVARQGASRGGGPREPGEVG
jgi:release factor glutamine methyltransferase